MQSEFDADEHAAFGADGGGSEFLCGTESAIETGLMCLGVFRYRRSRLRDFPEPPAPQRRVAPCFCARSTYRRQ